MDSGCCARAAARPRAPNPKRARQGRASDAHAWEDGRGSRKIARRRVKRVGYGRERPSSQVRVSALAARGVWLCECWRFGLRVCMYKLVRQLCGDRACRHSIECHSKEHKVNEMGEGVRAGPVRIQEQNRTELTEHVRTFEHSILLLCRHSILCRHARSPHSCRTS